MKIEVKGFLTIRPIMGEFANREIETEPTSILGLIDSLSEELGSDFNEMIYNHKTGEINDHMAILVNGRHYKNLPEKLRTLLEDGDNVAIFPPMAGG